MNNEQINKIYLEFGEEICGLSEETQKKIFGDKFQYWQELDNWWLTHQKEMEKEWRDRYLEVRKKEAEFVNEQKEFSKESRLRYLKELKEILDKEIIDELDYQEKLQERDVPYWWRSFSIDRLRRLIGKYQRVRKEIDILNNNQEGEITPEMIARAREYPISNLIEVNHNGFALCPFHEEKTPSLYTKNNFYYCFGCGASGDVIDLAMKLYHLTFPEAVKKLACG